MGLQSRSPDDHHHDDVEAGKLLQRQGAQAPSRAGRPSLVAAVSRALSVRSGTARVVLAAATAVAWMFFSSFLIMINKHILKDLNFPYPMTVSSMGMFASGLLSWLACRVFDFAEARAQVSPVFFLSNILPVGLFMAMTLWSGNAVYLYLTVSFIQMLKAFTPVITMLALFAARLETPNGTMIGSVLVIAAGTALSAYGEVAFDNVGAVIMFISAVSESLRLVMTQYLLVGCKMGPIEGLMYLGPACFVWLALGAALVEWPAIAATGALALAARHWVLFLVAACMGFLINVLAFATIKLASSLTLKVLGTVKNALLIVAAMAMYREVVTGLQAAGYLMSTAAFAVFTYVKFKQVAAGG
ncbi:drug metabolite transporter superfamily [Raphidocelis subcapitata]|uniref:Drug metabolite transporter superfamily n=1 Tax=Raphidocelis subcapitata TaxID=307507 RepID=A0A2V0P0H0_9CHLO|nr:drug metabolite transporter superfamily [Raphidocelis subcapitata]|eukprot:GBF93366.1 drug metabolite transporter superfamily [Raphidocelis subcapitata]